MKSSLAICLAFFMILALNGAYAQEEAEPEEVPEEVEGAEGVETVDSAEAKDAEEGGSVLDAPDAFELYIPSKMIADTEYEGMILVRNPGTTDIHIALATDNNDIHIPISLDLPAGDNHILFPIISTNTIDEDITIHAVARDGRSSTAVTRVYSIASIQTTVEIVAPTDSGTLKTTAKNVPVRIFLTDDHGIPVPSTSSAEITLSSTSSSVQFVIAGTIHDTATVTIAEGEYSANLQIQVNGDGVIYATVPGLSAGELAVNYRPNEVTVRLGVAPNPAPANSLGYYYVWLEQDGAVYIPDRVLDVFLSVGDKKKASFTADITSNKNEPHHVRLVDGINRGIFYLLEPGDTTLSVSIHGFGSDSVELEILEKSEEDANSIEAWIFPETPAGQAWAVVGTYYDPTLEETEEGVEIESGSDSVDSERGVVLEGGSDDIVVTILDEENIRRPAAAQMTRILVSSDGGIIHDNEFEFGTTGSTARNHLEDSGIDPSDFSAIEVPLEIVDISDHIMSFTGNEIAGIEVQLVARPLFGLDHTLAVFTIPANIDILGDVAFASVVDDGGYLVNVGGVINDAKPNVSQVGNSLSELALRPGWMGGTTIVQGVHEKEGGRIFVQVPGLRSQPTALAISGVQTGIEIWAPEVVNTREEFPVTIHAVDSNGVPVFILKDSKSYLISSDELESTDGVHEHTAILDADARVLSVDPHTHFVTNAAGNLDITIIANDRYLAKRTIVSFDNKPNSEITVTSKTPDTVRLGNDIVLDVLTGALENPFVDITGLEFWQDESGKFRGTPEEPGEYEIKVNVRDEGWADYTKNLRYTVEEQVDITYLAQADDGVGISVVMGLTAPESPEALFRSDVPGVIKPGIFEMSMPLTFEVGSDRIYALKSVSINGETINHAERFTVHITEDSDVIASYEREIVIDYVAFFDSPNIDGFVEGSRMYGYGEVVVLRAPPIPEFYGLVWNLPEKWENLPEGAVIAIGGQSVSFQALDSSSGNVIYVQNYGALMALIAASITVPLVLIWKRSPDTLYNLTDNIRGITGKIKGGGFKKTRLPKVGRKK